jgi:hypothetical protein
MQQPQLVNRLDIMLLPLILSEFMPLTGNKDNNIRIN